MTKHQLLLAVYERSRGATANEGSGGLDGKTLLQHFLDLNKNHGMASVTRDTFTTIWQMAVKYPAKIKLDIITERQNELKNELCETMLAIDPPWESVLDWARLIKGAQDHPSGLPAALDALEAYEADKATAYREKCRLEFPGAFEGP